MSVRRAAWRWGMMALGLVLLTGGSPAGAQNGWSFQLEWEYSGATNTVFRLCVDGACSPLPATRRGVETWRAPMPMLPLGEHRLVIEACVGTACMPGDPDIIVRVVPPTSRRPPLDIVDGPRIPVNRR